jgi:hypothetical protein
VLVNFALQAAEGGVGNKGGGGGEGGSGMEEIEGGEEGGKEVTESANEVSRIALGGPGSEVAGVDGRESADEVAERDASLQLTEAYATVVATYGVVASECLGA